MTISIITPSYNQGQFIERTIQSVLSQNVPGLEYIVVDGGSTDDTINVLRRMPSCQWLSEPDRGQTHAVNKGIQLTTGNIIGWLNSDDIYYPNALKTILDYFNQHPEIDVIYGDAYHIDTHDQILELYYTEAWNIERLKEVCYLCQPAVFFRRSMIDRFGVLDENLHYCMDYEYWLRLASRGARFAHVPQIVAGSRLHSDTKTLGSRIKVHKEINDMLKNTLKKVPDRWLSNYAHAFVKTTYQDKYPAWRINQAIGVETIIAAFRWNKWINWSLLQQNLRLIAGCFRQAIIGNWRE